MTRTPRSPTTGVMENVRESRRESLAAPESITPRPVLTREDVAELRDLRDWLAAKADRTERIGATVSADYMAGKARLLDRLAGVLETLVQERAA